MSINETSQGNAPLPEDVDDWKQTQWEQYWGVVIGTDYLKVSQVTRNFYYNTFLEILGAPDSKDPTRLENISQNYAPLLDANSKEAIPFIIGLDRDKKLQAYQAYLRVSGIIGEVPYRFTGLHWEEPIVEIEANPEKRIWAADTVYPFVSGNFDQTNQYRFEHGRVQLGSQDILYYIVGILEPGAITDQMINNQYLRQKVTDSHQSRDEFFTFMHLASQRYYQLRLDYYNLERIKVGTIAYLRQNFPAGFTFDQLYESYPIVFDWLAVKLQIKDLKTYFTP